MGANPVDLKACTAHLKPANTLYLLDASIVYFRYYFSMPDHWVSEDGVPMGAVYGFAHWLKRFLAQRQPLHMAVCFDESLGTCFRNALDPQYKCSRPPADEIIRYQLSACQTLCGAMGLSVYKSEQYEADDLIGTLAHRFRAPQKVCCIMSRDKDLQQLLKPGDIWWDYPDGKCLDYANSTLSWGVSPEQLPDYLALVGDTVDDIPGVPGIGAKTAVRLLQTFGSIKNLYQQLDAVASQPWRGAKSVADKLRQAQSRVKLNQKLTKIHIGAKLNSRYSVKIKRMDPSVVRAVVKPMGFSLNVE